jgi:hypothetical protein
MAQRGESVQSSAPASTKTSRSSSPTAHSCSTFARNRTVRSRIRPTAAKAGMDCTMTITCLIPAATGRSSDTPPGTASGTGADGGGRDADWLLFSNAESAGERRNLTIKLSCDRGRSWAFRRTVEAGPSAYSTLARLHDGNFAIAYERADYSFITLITFSPAWLPGSCTDFRPPLHGHILSGSSDTVRTHPVIEKLP